jgi:hypothetical protein
MRKTQPQKQKLAHINDLQSEKIYKSDLGEWQFSDFRNRNAGCIPAFDPINEGCFVI